MVPGSGTDELAGLSGNGGFSAGHAEEPSIGSRYGSSRPHQEAAVQLLEAVSVEAVALVQQGCGDGWQ